MYLTIFKIFNNIVTATHVSFSTLSLDRYFKFNMATAKNPALHKYNVANGSKHKDFLATSRYLSLMFQNPKS